MSHNTELPDDDDDWFNDVSIHGRHASENVQPANTNARDMATTSAPALDGIDRAHMLATLRRYYGHSSFREHQWEIVSAVVSGRRDQLVVMATGECVRTHAVTCLGYGKSVCYQLPPIATDQLAIVVSPLISLMEDQVENLKYAANVLFELMCVQSRRHRRRLPGLGAGQD
jgi:superfamily II DNA helicase RecQ